MGPIWDPLSLTVETPEEDCWYTDNGDILLLRLAFMDVRAMVCLLQETYQSFVSPIFGRADRPPFESRDEDARVRTA